MNCLIKNFKKLSAKQIKTYAAVILMSAVTIEASALETIKGLNPEPEMEAAFIEVEEMYIESWMLSPFDMDNEETVALEIAAPLPSEMVFETELAMESWMATPFETQVAEVIPVDQSMCSPAP